MKSTQRGYGLGPSCLGALSRARLLVAFQELGGIGLAGVPAGGIVVQPGEARPSTAISGDLTCSYF